MSRLPDIGLEISRDTSTASPENQLHITMGAFPGIRFKNKEFSDSTAHTRLAATGMPDGVSATWRRLGRSS